MSYSYEASKPEVFKEENQKLFLAIRDNVTRLIKVSGAATLHKAIDLPPGIGAADSWTMIACIHRLVELGEIVETTRDIFVAGKK